MTFHLNIIRGEIVMTFGQLLSWMSWSPANARELANTLNKMADEIEKAEREKPEGRIQ